jgi:hypothetical protein
MSERDNRTRDAGAKLMLETVVMRFGFLPVMHFELWDRYVDGFRAQREEAIQHQLKLVRFSIQYRAGRDLDWIRSYRRYGLPPVPDD